MDGNLTHSPITPVSPMSPSDRPARIAGLLRCPTCEAIETFNPAELEKYARSGWPTCCGETMTLFTETRKPLAEVKPKGDTPLDGTKAE